MDKIISLLQSLFSLNRLAAITLPGVFSAAAIVYLLRPTPPIDVIPAFRERPEVKASLERCRAAIKDISFPLTSDNKTNFAKCQAPAAQACEDNGMPMTLEDTFGTGFRHRRDLSRKNQEELEKEKQQIARCMNIEKSWQGIEKLKIDMTNADISTLQAQLTAAQQNVIEQEKTNSTLLGRYRARLDQVLTSINLQREDILFYQQSANYRQSNLDELTRVDGIISARLGEPGRLRPPKAFDDYISGLINHVVGFVLLALALGMIVSPISQAVTTACYDVLFPDGF